MYTSITLNRNHKWFKGNILYSVAKGYKYNKYFEQIKAYSYLIRYGK